MLCEFHLNKETLNFREGTWGRMLGGNQHHQEHHPASYVEVKTVSLLKPGPSSQQLLLPSIWGSASALGISLSLSPLLTHLPPPRNSQELGQSPHPGPHNQRLP